MNYLIECVVLKRNIRCPIFSGTALKCCANEKWFEISNTPSMMEKCILLSLWLNIKRWKSLNDCLLLLLLFIFNDDHIITVFYRFVSCCIFNRNEKKLLLVSLFFWSKFSAVTRTVRVIVFWC